MDLELLESYLLQLERHLLDVSASVRAEAITTVKTQILEMATGGTLMREVLSRFPSPIEKANEVRLAKGYPKIRSQKSSVLKWLFFSTAGALLLFVVIIALFVHFFSPLIEISTDQNRVKILGGLIDMDNSSGPFAFGHNGFAFDDERTKGSFKLKPNQKIEIHLTNAKIKLHTASSEEISYQCLTSGPVGEPAFEDTPQAARLEIISTFGAKCSFSIPKGREVFLSGDNVKLNLDSPNFSFHAQIGNGSVLIRRAKDVAYRFDNSVAKGRNQEFESSSDPRAYLISVHLKSGVIQERGEND